MEEFDSVLGDRLNQVGGVRDEVVVSAADLLSVPDTPGEVTDEGVAANVRVGIGYLDSWLRGVGAAAIDNLMEDVATAEISRSQLWQWVRHGKAARERVLEEIERVEAPEEAKEVFTEVALADDFVEFLTLPAYDRLT
jgi:malate synthase